MGGVCASTPPPLITVMPRSLPLMLQSSRWSELQAGGVLALDLTDDQQRDRSIALLRARAMEYKSCLDDRLV